MTIGHPLIRIIFNQGTTDNGGTALHWASYHGHADIVGLLLEHPDIRVDQETDAGAIALNFATEGRSLEAVRLLLKHPGTDVNHAQNMTESWQFCTGCTSLMTAALKGFPTIAEILLQQNNVDVNVVSLNSTVPYSGCTALGMAALVGNKGWILSDLDLIRPQPKPYLSTTKDGKWQRHASHLS